MRAAAVPRPNEWPRVGPPRRHQPQHSTTNLFSTKSFKLQSSAHHHPAARGPPPPGARSGSRHSPARTRRRVGPHGRLLAQVRPRRFSAKTLASPPPHRRSTAAEGRDCWSLAGASWQPTAQSIASLPSHSSLVPIFDEFSGCAQDGEGARRRSAAPRKGPASGFRGDENSGLAGVDSRPSGAGAASRPPSALSSRPGSPGGRCRRPRRVWGQGSRQDPSEVGAVTIPLRPTKILGKPKPVLRLGFSTTGPTLRRSNVPGRNSISRWKENHTVQNVSSTSQQDDSHAPAKEQNNSEDTLSLQLELAITKTILLEEIKARAEADVRATALGDELKAANQRTLEACRQKEAKEKELQDTISVLDVVESEQISLIKEIKELKKNTELEQGRDEVHRQAMGETYEVIISLEKQLLSLQQELDACKKELLVAKQSLDETARIEILLDQSIETLVQKEVLEQYFVSLLGRIEEETRQLESQLDQSKTFYEDRIKGLEIKMQEMDYQAGALLISWNKEKRKTFAEEKDKLNKLLEMSNEDAETTVCSLEEKVKLLEEEAEQHRRQQEKLEVELQNARRQLLPYSREAKSSLEDRIFDSPDPTRQLSNINNGVVRSQESRMGRKELSESEVMMAFFEEQMQGSYASSFGDIFKEAADDSLPASHSLPHITSQIKPNPSAVEEAVELDTIAVGSTPLVEHQEEPGEPSSDECMHEAGPSDLDMTKAHSLEKDFWSENSEFDSEEQVAPPAVESVIEVLKENELPPVSLVRPSDPVAYDLAPSDELKKLRSRNHYEGHRTATDRRFWSIEQQDLYKSIYSKPKSYEMKWIDWDYIDSIDEFSCVRQRFVHVGLEKIISYHCDWDIELIRQFYSTVHISVDNSSITWMADGRRITTNKRAWEERFGIPRSVHTAIIHSEFLLHDDDKRIMYTAPECTLGLTRGLSPLVSIANKIIKTTIYPKSATIHGHDWNLLRHIVEQNPFDIIALIFSKIELLISDPSPSNLFYAPYIMGMIMRAFEYDGPRETRHPCYRPKPARAVALPSEPPPSAFQPEVEAHVEADDHIQFKEAGGPCRLRSQLHAPH
ncbi:hypothetical protein ZWY2020_035973 [Hordeum vulgare]|nr:hypothetical protein ZWY2020_035973 [Hordeum vulgare]